MRISTFWMQQSAVNAMLDQQAQVAHTQLEVSTGRRILSPSDDPAGASRALGLTHASAQNAQYQRNIDSAQSRLGNEDQTLSSVSDLLGRVRTLALEGQNGTLDSGDRRNIATEIRQRLSQLVGTVGTNTQQAQNGLTAQTALLNQSIAAQQNVSGVNLDEEAANLVRYQQSYQAAAQVISVASTLFDSVLAAMQGS